MKLSNNAYQNIIARLDEIQETCSLGITSRNARDCLMDISTAVFLVRQELNTGVTLDKEEGVTV